MEPRPPAAADRTHAAGSDPSYSEPTGSGPEGSGRDGSGPWTAVHKNQNGHVWNMSHVSGQSKNKFLISQLPLSHVCTTANAMKLTTKFLDIMN